MPHDLRPLVIAYNDFAIAASDDAYEIGQYSFDRNVETLSLSVDFVVLGSSATDLASKVSALDVLRAKNGTLLIQQARELELNDLVGDGTTTVTSATGGFTSSHVNDWIVIHTVGARRITAVGGSTSITVHASVSAGTYRAIKPARLFRGTNTDRTFMLGEGSYQKIPGSTGNTEYSAVYRLQVAGKIPLKSASGGASPSTTAGGLVKLNAGISYDASRRRTFTIGGEFQTVETTLSTVSAKTIHDDNVDALVTLHLAGFGGSASYERTSRTEGWKMEDLRVTPETSKVYTFSQTWKERFVADDTSIIDQSLTVRQSQGNISNGLGLTGPCTAQVEYRCAVNHDVRGRGRLLNLYTSVIRNLIADAITVATQNGRGSQVIQREDMTIDQSANAISAIWDVLLLDDTSTVLAFSAPQTKNNDPGIGATPLWDGKEHTYAIWRNKPSRSRTNAMTIRSLEPIKFDSEGAFVPGNDHPFKVGALGGVNVEGAVGKGRVRIRWPQDAGGNAAGKWIQKGNESLLENTETIGVSQFGRFATATIYNSTLTRVELFVIDADPIVPKFNDTVVISPGV